MDSKDAMENEPKKRPWFQVHLSTAIVLMFTAGFIIWANTRVTIWELDHRPKPRVPQYANEDGVLKDFIYGWPIQSCKFGTFIASGPRDQSPNWHQEGFDYDVIGCLIDVIVALAILFSVMIACERLQRKHTN